MYKKIALVFIYSILISFIHNAYIFSHPHPSTSDFIQNPHSEYYNYDNDINDYYYYYYGHRKFTPRIYPIQQKIKVKIKIKKKKPLLKNKQVDKPAKKDVKPKIKTTKPKPVIKKPKVKIKKKTTKIKKPIIKKENKKQLKTLKKKNTTVRKIKIKPKKRYKKPSQPKLYKGLKTQINETIQESIKVYGEYTVQKESLYCKLTKSGQKYTAWIYKPDTSDANCDTVVKVKVSIYAKLKARGANHLAWIYKSDAGYNG